MSQTVFNREIKKRLFTENHSVIDFLNEEIKSSKNFKDYHSFFSEYLLQLGVVSLEYVPMSDQNKYVPYVNCLKINIFSEKEGNTSLSDKGENSSSCQKIMVNYLIEKFKILNLEQIENWKSLS